MQVLTIEQLAMRDLFLKEMNSLLEEKKRELLEQYNEVNRIYRETGKETEEYRETRKYYDYIISKKEEQDAAFNSILDNLTNLKEKIDDNSDLAEKLTQQKNEITNKKTILKKEIDEIIRAENG